MKVSLLHVLDSMFFSFTISTNKGKHQVITMQDSNIFQTLDHENKTY